MSSKNRRAWAGALLLLFVPAIAFAAVEIFLRIDGVDGESTDAKHKNEIDVESWSWSWGSGQRPAAAAGKQGCALGAATFGLKGAVSGPKLAMFQMQKRPIPSMVVDFRGERHMLRNVMLTGHQEMRLGDGSVRHTFDATFNCATHPGGVNVGFPKVEIKGESPAGILIGLLLPSVQQKAEAPPAAMTLAKLEIQGTRAELLVKAGDPGHRALAQAFATKRPLPTLKLAGRAPNEWTFTDVTIVAIRPSQLPGWEQVTLKFGNVVGPLSGVAYKPQ